ncbi:MAG: YjdF family protein [Dermatophilaceae bacterium]
MSGQFTVYFDGQFWVGVLETEDAGQLRAARHVFGPEPSDVELYQFLLTEGGALIDVALKNPPVEGRLGVRWPRNPKRIQRQVSREAALPTTSTAAQQALRHANEQRAAERTKLARQRKADQCEDAYRKRRQRAKAKHRGH